MWRRIWSYVWYVLTWPFSYDNLIPEEDLTTKENFVLMGIVIMGAMNLAAVISTAFGAFPPWLLWPLSLSYIFGAMLPIVLIKQFTKKRGE